MARGIEDETERLCHDGKTKHLSSAKHLSGCQLCCNTAGCGSVTHIAQFGNDWVGYNTSDVCNHLCSAHSRVLLESTRHVWIQNSVGIIREGNDQGCNEQALMPVSQFQLGSQRSQEYYLVKAMIKVGLVHAFFKIRAF